jgi:hypothetical protein
VRGGWQFDMGDLTIGQLVDFFAEHGGAPEVTWHNEGGGPSAYLMIWGYERTEAFATASG